MALEFGINDIDLTSYVSRHTMAMSLQNNEIPREVISQILGHKDLKTKSANFSEAFCPKSSPHWVRTG